MGEYKDIKVVLLDIEGTICPISFVKDVLFPYALDVLPSTVRGEWESPAFQPYKAAYPPTHSATPEALIAHTQDLMSQDLKIPYMKKLQGYLWLSGYESGVLKCPLFSDVSPALHSWKRDHGVDVIIYSSGSVAAQKLLFQYTNVKPEADLRGLVSGWFDTVNAGAKQEVQSYEKIMATCADEKTVAKERWLFLSDNVGEVEAALGAGMQSAVVVRDGNKALSEEEKVKHRIVEGFGDIVLV